MENTQNLTADKVKSHLLQEVNYSGSESSAALLARKQKAKSLIKCFECNRYGHFATDCPNKKGKGPKPERGESLLYSVFVAKSKSRDKWIVKICPNEKRYHITKSPSETNRSCQLNVLAMLK